MPRLDLCYQTLCLPVLLLAIFANSLELDQAQQNIGLDVASELFDTLNVFLNLRTVDDIDWLQSFKQFFINVPYHILVSSLTLIALF